MTPEPLYRATDCFGEVDVLIVHKGMACVVDEDDELVLVHVDQLTRKDNE